MYAENFAKSSRYRVACVQSPITINSVPLNKRSSWLYIINYKIQLKINSRLIKRPGRTDRRSKIQINDIYDIFQKCTNYGTTP